MNCSNHLPISSLLQISACSAEEGCSGPWFFSRLYIITPPGRQLNNTFYHHTNITLQFMVTWLFMFDSCNFTHISKLKSRCWNLCILRVRENMANNTWNQPFKPFFFLTNICISGASQRCQELHWLSSIEILALILNYKNMWIFRVSGKGSFIGGVFISFFKTYRLLFT